MFSAYQIVGSRIYSDKSVRRVTRDPFYPTDKQVQSGQGCYCSSWRSIICIMEPLISLYNTSMRLSIFYSIFLIIVRLGTVESLYVNQAIRGRGLFGTCGTVM